MSSEDNYRIGEERELGEPSKECKGTLPKMRLWVLEFTVNGSKGCSIIKAHDANRAIRELKSSGMYNGTPDVYQVTRVEEIIESPDMMLICEQIN